MTVKPYEYFVSVFNPDPRVVVIERFEGVGSPYLLKEGIPLKGEYPDNAVFPIANDSGDMMTDFIDNISRQVLISERVKEFFENHNLTEQLVEYLPFQIKNKRGRLEKNTYYIANSILNISCLDMKESEYSLNAKKTAVRTLKKMILDRNKLPEDAIFFRVKEEPSRIIFRSDFVDELKKAGFTGLSLCPEGKKLP